MTEMSFLFIIKKIIIFVKKKGKYKKMNIFQIKKKINYIPRGFNRSKILIYNKKLKLTNNFFIVRSFAEDDVAYRIDYIDPSQLHEHLLMLRLNSQIYFLGDILSHRNCLIYYIFYTEKDIKYLYDKSMNIGKLLYPNCNDKNINNIINEFKEKICNPYLLLIKL